MAATDAPTALSLRGAWIWIHRWVGLLMVPVLVIEGVTGSLVAFRAPLSRWLAPAHYARAPASGAAPLALGELATKVQAHIGPHARVAYFFDGSERGQTMVRVGPATDAATGKPYAMDFGWVAVDPWTGTELARYSNDGYTAGVLPNVMPFMYRLHTTLTLGDLGYWILGLTAIAWTLDCLYALYLTFPRGRHRFFHRWKKAWTIKTKAGAFRINFDLHRAGGLWLWALFLVFAWSSVQLTLNQVYEPVMATFFDYRTIDREIGDLPQRPSTTPPKLDWIAAQAAGNALIAERARIEGFKPLRSTMMAYFGPNGIYSYSVTTDRAFPDFSEYNVWFDADTGELFRILRSNGEHTGNTITNWLRALHFAADPMDQPWYRWLICITGLYTVVLCATGVYIWWKKRSSRRWSARRASFRRRRIELVHRPLVDDAGPHRDCLTEDGAGHCARIELQAQGIPKSAAGPDQRPAAPGF